ncbi:hypothetical protein F4553_001486 [Allocatelliglobosispora scoriae]|uniref:F5/8 type C domain-containing protein n=1 Tax=Allocatelliglobosispora scoriae TaxID=643052 RepID=A0A841BG94_9ACTN|nr:discoidin domain-containing protein [Allocatelliglobosispora scoriae]MBB5868107.1 hypothetical protein [Allocatelliglobosispora scoriae]
MKMRAVAFVLVAGLGIACGTSDLADDAEVVVSGVLAAANGTPASGVGVVLVPRPHGLDALAEVAASVTSIGIVCLTKQVALCKGTRRTTTAADGTYRFAMKGKDAKTLLGNPVGVVLTAAAPSGARVESTFELSEAAVSLPRIAFWEPAGLSVSPGPRSIAYSWPGFANTPKPQGYRLLVTESAQTLWSQDTGVSGKLDARVVADAQAELHAVAVTRQNGFTIEHHSPSVPLAGMAGAPPSRGSDCSVAGRDGAAPLSPCPLTDGAYAASFPAQSCTPPSQSPAGTSSGCPANTWITVDLGEPRPISAVVLHGLAISADPEIRTSDDGVRWTKRARHGNAEYALLMIKPPVTARYVRLQSADPSAAISFLAELSIWP